MPLRFPPVHFQKHHFQKQHFACFFLESPLVNSFSLPQCKCIWGQSFRAVQSYLERFPPLTPQFDVSYTQQMHFLVKCSLFCFGNHQKKRPNNLIFGRMFDWQLLDMVEFGVVDYEPMQSTKVLLCFCCLCVGNLVNNFIFSNPASFFDIVFFTF